MATPRHSGNRDTGNLPAERAALVNPLIPLAITLEIAQKYSQHARLPCVIFLNIGRWWKPILSKQREKATQ